jgi:hypothetical protein
MLGKPLEEGEQNLTLNRLIENLREGLRNHWVRWQLPVEPTSLHQANVIERGRWDRTRYIGLWASATRLS